MSRSIPASLVLLLTVTTTVGRGEQVRTAPEPAAAGPRFDVVSVKPRKNDDTPIRLDVQPGGRVTAVNIPLKQLIRAAYTLQLDQIVNAPGWTESERFDISGIADRELATTAVWKPGTFAPIQLLLQSLLADRFRMVVHTETRPSQVYVLVRDNTTAGKRGPTPAADRCAPACAARITNGSLAWRDVPLPQFAELLSQLTGRVVTDETGLAGTFDIELQWSPDLQQQAVSDAPSIFTAVQEQLGLRLEPRRGSIPVLVIDSIQSPSPD
jgi:uncharacterized protein (TIGR03435 family)